MIYVVDEPVKTKDPIGNMIFTPEVLPDPIGLFSRIKTGEKNVLYPVAAFCDVFTVCYGGGDQHGDKAYLVPVGHNLDIDLTRGNGTMIIKQDGTVIVPKGTFDKTVNPLEIRTYEQFINTTADQSFQNLLSEIRYWVTTRLDLADDMYNTITKED